MFSHVTIGTNNLERTERFYDALLTPIGLVQRKVTVDGGPKALCWVLTGHSLPRFYVYEPFDRAPASAGNGTMIAFLAASPVLVDKIHAAGIAAGGSDDGPPGLRLRYGEGYYGAYLRDPDGNKIHVVYRGDLA